ncbi:MAG: dihydroxyacetone kinase subunit DhaK, partial [Bacteroidales bacterium]
HPQNNAIISDLPEGEMEIGMGQHGEGGGGRQVLISADDTAEKMVKLLSGKLNLKAGDKTILIINGTGSTTLMEMSIVYRRAAQVLQEMGTEVVFGRIDEILTVQEQHGFQMIIARVDDDHINYLKNYMSNAPYWTAIGK